MPTPQVENSRLGSFITFVTILLVVAIMRIAEDVVVPVAISVLLAFLLSPLVNRLARWGLPEVLAIGLTASLAFAVLAAIGWVVGTQAVAVLDDLPRHEPNIRAKISSFQSFAPGGPFSRTTGMVNSLTEQAQAAESEQAEKRERERRRAGDPVPVVITGSRESRMDVVQRLVAPALGPLGTGGIVIVFVLVILFQRHDLRDRFINLISAGQVNVATQAVDDAAHRISRYLGMQLFVNATYGIPVAIGLSIIGVPGAILWGLLAMVLRFIPFIGPWIAAAFPIALAAAIDPGWTKLLYTIGLFVVLELISNNVVEVLVYGTSTGISSFALLVAAVFWTWLWGTAGLFLSTPLTACLLVMGKYVPGLKFLSVVLGSAPSTTASALFYQRMLSMNFEGMLALARQHLKDRPVEAFYDEVFIPALIMAEEDRHSGALAEVRQRFIPQAGTDLVEELAGNEELCVRMDRRAAATDTHAVQAVVIPANDEADELVAHMLCHVLDCRGWSVTVSPLTAPESECLALLREGRGRVAVISALPPSAVTAARKMCRRLKSELPDTSVIVGVWTPEGRPVELQSRFRLVRPTAIATSVGEAASWVERILTGEVAVQPQSASEGSRGPKAPPAELFERIRRDVAAAFEIPVSLVKVSDIDRAYWGGMPWFTEHVDVVGTGLRDSPLAAVPADEPVLEVGDIRKDKRLAANAVLEERGVRYLACAPLRLRDGRVVGLLCAVDTRVRTVSEESLRVLTERATELMGFVEGRGASGGDEPRLAAVGPGDRHSGAGG